MRLELQAFFVFGENGSLLERGRREGMRGRGKTMEQFSYL